nr:putative uncharacterized protein FRMD6-AS1 [Taeniopygia guttata]
MRRSQGRVGAGAGGGPAATGQARALPGASPSPRLRYLLGCRYNPPSPQRRSIPAHPVTTATAGTALGPAVDPPPVSPSWARARCHGHWCPHGSVTPPRRDPRPPVPPGGRAGVPGGATPGGVPAATPGL